jgi:4-hydroxythreonine-4-phosphate dehydrogenase
MDSPLLAVTMGDPAGIGPETIAGVWSSAEVHRLCRPFVVGHPVVMRRAAALRGLLADIVEIDAPEEARPAADVLPCLRATRDDAADVPPGVIDPRGGQAAYDALLSAAALALAGRIDGIVTAPLHKAALWRAGHHYPGHTELLAELCGTADVAMMLYLGPDEGIRGTAGLGVAHVTLHTALRRVWDGLSVEAIVAKTRLAADVMRAMKGTQPRVGICALNPHAGEEGLFGDEEQTIIAPAVAAAAAEGYDVQGPLPADTLLVKARDGLFDAVVAMYHDQGHIALKLLGMHRAVNITLGLPIVRTSVAHGTAFDLAWRGQAETSSMVEAIRVAARLTALRRSSATWASTP